jgi:hypothetical protein
MFYGDWKAKFQNKFCEVEKLGRATKHFDYSHQQVGQSFSSASPAAADSPAGLTK